MLEVGMYTILEPPTQAEVEKGARKALAESGVLPLVILAARDIPRPTPQEVAVRIFNTVHPEEGGLLISGWEPEEDPHHRQTYHISTDPEQADQPAILTVA